MNINRIQTNSFKGITLQPGGLEYVKAKEGEEVLKILDKALKEFKSSKWELNIGQKGYSFTSPTTSKTYTGPFSIKRSYKTTEFRKNPPRIIVRMDKLNRVKFPVYFNNKLDVSSVYRKIKNASGLKQLILLLAVLEGRSIL